jgi:hypothetical protein
MGRTVLYAKRWALKIRIRKIIKKQGNGGYAERGDEEVASRRTREHKQIEGSNGWMTSERCGK